MEEQYEQIKLIEPARRLFVVVVRPDDTTFKQEIPLPEFDYQFLQTDDPNEWEYVLYSNKELAELLNNMAPKFGCKSDFEVRRDKCEVRIYGTRHDMSLLLKTVKVDDDLSSIAHQAIQCYQKMLGRGYYISDYWFRWED